jgi:serine protease Do
VTAGIVSATGRDEVGLAPNAYVDFLQIDAPINQGNSGGPTFNGNGEVIGINSQILSPNGGGSVGIGFAIPANIAKPIVAQLEKSGKVMRGYLGVQMQQITPDMEDALGLSSTNGVLVASVVPEGPAAKGGIKAGDVIVGFGDQPIKTLHDLGRDVANTPVGQKIQLKLLREAKPDTATVAIEQRKDEELVARAEESQGGGQGALGLQLGALDQTTRQQLQIPQSVTGALITGVTPDSPAEEQGLREGDIVVRVDNTEIKSPNDVSEAVKKAGKAGKKAVALLVNRKGGSTFVAVPIGKGDG